MSLLWGCGEMALSPVLIAGVGGGTLGAFSGVQFGAVQRIGQLWEFVSEPAPITQTIGAYLFAGRQTNSYTLEGGATAGPSSVSCAMYWDGASNLVSFLWSDGVAAYLIRQFNLDTQAWGADFPASNAPAYALYSTTQNALALWQRSNGSYIALIGNYTVILSAGAWTNAADYTLNAQALGLSTFANSTSILDALNILHVIFQETSQNRWFYQQVLPDGTLGVFQEFAGQGGVPQDLYTAATASTMVIQGGSLLWGIVRNGTDPNLGTYQFPAVYVGSPLSNPVWTESDSIDPNGYINLPGPPFPFPQPPTTYPNLFFQNGVLYAVYIRSVYTGGNFPLQEGAIQISQTSNAAFLAGWRSAQFYDPNFTPTLFPPGDTAFGFTPLLAFNPAGQVIGVSVDYTDTSVGGPEQRYWILGAPYPTPGLAGGSTGARFKPCLRQGTEWIQTQLAEKLRAERAKRSAWPYRHLFPAGVDVEVNQLADIVAPPQDGNLHVILQYKVPSGFRFWLDAILQDGPQPFTPGDAIWVVDENSQLASSSQASRIQGLVNIPYPMGSIRDGKLWHFEMPYDFDPLTVIRSKVMNVNFAPGAPNYFTSGFFGFLVPLVKGE